jgi:glycosyltransferase involved in cell wall biosynthesis
MIAGLVHLPDQRISTMRILWFSNKILTDADSGTTGTWLDAMARLLVQSGKVELGNIALGPVVRTTRQDCNSIQQWVVPAKARPQRKGLPAPRFVAEIVKAVNEFSPDLVHVWGVEGFWGLLTAKDIIRYPALLEMQGLKSAIARVFTGGLSIREQFACIGLKEILRHSTMFHQRRQFQSWEKFEREIILGHRFITAQSGWLKAQIKAIHPKCTLFHNDFVLRSPFYHAKSWQYSGNNIIFYTASYPLPFKGVHTAIRTIAILKNRFPKIQLRIAGALQRSGIRREGYIAWLNGEAKRLKVEENLHWLGPLSADQIIMEMYQCSAVFLPTFIEGYCLALAEAMILGVPTAVSFVGGASQLANDEESALFFPPGDEKMAAYQLERILTDRDLAEWLSRNARAIALVRNDPRRILQKQLEIYRQVIAQSESRI